MSAVLNTNVASLWASKNLLGAQNKMADSVERLSSGLRINRARDDAAGLGITGALTTQINAANQGVRNLNDGISLVQTAEGAITAAVEMAQRISTLATQASNSTFGKAERDAIQAEMKQLVSSIGSIDDRTKFSDNSLLSNKSFTIQISNESSDTFVMASGGFADIGTFSTTGTAAGDLSAKIDSIVTSGSTAVSDFNSIQGLAKTYITELNTQRSLLGAYQNRLEYTVSNVTDLSANLSAARSRVQDTDYAAETANLTKGQILQQAATAMLAQANQMPNVILTLLK
jgi:flagellin